MFFNKKKKIEVKKDFYTHISFGDVSFDGCLITSKQVMFPIKNFKYWRIDDANNLNIFFDDGNGISKVIINKNNDVINIGDILKIEVIYDEDDIEVFKVKLTGKYLPDLESSIQEISLNSQMGKALYLKNIHNKITYKIHGEEVEIKVLEKNGNIVN